MLLRLNPRDDAPLFVQLANTLRIAVVRGDAGPGERLPSARALAASLDINVHTVLHAYQELRDEGLVELRRGRGATVAAAAAQDFAAIRAQPAGCAQDGARARPGSASRHRAAAPPARVRWLGIRSDLKGRYGLVLRAGDAIAVQRAGGGVFVATVDGADDAVALLNGLADRARAT